MRCEAVFTRARLWTGFKILLALVLIVVLFARTSPTEILDVWQRASLVWLLGSFLFFYATFWAMAQRYWLLIGRRIPFSNLLGLVIFQTVLGNLVATSAGAISYVVMLRARYNIRATTGVSSLILSRLGDAVVVWLALLVAVGFVWGQVQSLHWLLVALMLGLGGILLACASVLIWRERLVHLVERILAKTPLAKSAVLHSLVEKASALAQISTAELVQLGLRAAFWSFAIFAINFAFAICNVAMFHVPIGMPQLLFLYVFTLLLGILPIQVFGGLGVYEVSMVFLYGMFGIDAAYITPILLSWRVLFYVMNLLVLVYLPIEGHFKTARDLR